MPSKNSHSDRLKSTCFYNSDHELRPLTIREKERVTGMRPNDAEAYGYCKGARHHTCGNAFLVGGAAPMLSAVLRKPPPPVLLGLVHQRKGIHLYTQASRLLARHSLHVQDSTSLTADVDDTIPSSTTPEHTLAEASPGVGTASPEHQLLALFDTTVVPLIERIRTAPHANPQQTQNLKQPPIEYVKHLDLLFL
eukprot:scaffold7_cov414-Pavlova_lutheri.AAC.19